MVVVGESGDEGVLLVEHPEMRIVMTNAKAEVFIFESRSGRVDTHNHINLCSQWSGDEKMP